MAFGKSCIDLGSDLAEVQNVVDVTFKTMNDDLNKWAKNAVSTFGLSETTAKKYAGLYGSMAEAFGFSEKEAYQMSTTLAGLAGDVASFYNIEQDVAYTKLKAVFSGETEALKDLGIVMTQAALDNYSMQQGIGKTVQEMSEAEKVSLRYKFILSQLQNASGDFARTQDGWANQTRILQLRFDSLKASIGDGLIKAFSPALKTVNNLIGRLQVLADSFSNTIGSIFGIDTSASNAVASTVAAEKELMNSADQSAASVDGVTDSINKSAEAAERSVASFDKLNILSLDKNKKKGSTTPATTDTTSLTGNLKKKSEALFDKITDSWKRRVDKIVASTKKSLGNIKSAVGSIADSWKRVWNNGTGKRILDNTASLLSNIFGTVGDIAEAFKKAWEKAGKGDSVVQAIQDKWSSLVELLDTITTDFREVWNDGTGERIWGNILSIIENCNRYTATWREKIKKAWESNGTGKRIWGTILGIVEDITGFLAEMSEIRLEWLEDLDLNPVAEAVASLGEAFRELLKACGNQFKVVYKEVFLPLAKWTIEKAAPTLMNLLAKAMKFFADVIKRIPKSVLKGIASGILAVVAASKAAKVISKVTGWLKGLKAAKDAGGWIDVLKKSFAKLKLNPYAVAIGAVVAAVVALVDAVKTYNKTKWENSGVKKATDKINEFSESLQEAADNMKEKVKEISDNHIEVQADVSEIENLKDELKKLIKDGVITEDEMPEYTVIMDMLKDVEGFEETWNTFNPEQKDGKIVITTNIDEANKKLDEFVKAWGKEQYKLALKDDYSNIYSSLAQNGRDIKKAKNNVNEAKQNLIDIIKESRAGIEYYDIGGLDSWINAYQSGKIQFGLLDADRYKEITQSYLDASDALDDYTESQRLLKKDLEGNLNAQKLLAGETDNYAGAVYGVESNLFSEAEAVEYVKDKNLSSFGEIKKEYQKTTGEFSKSADEVGKKSKETSKNLDIDFESNAKSLSKLTLGKARVDFGTNAARIEKFSSRTKGSIKSDAKSMEQDIADVGKSSEKASAPFKTGTDKIASYAKSLKESIREKLGKLPDDSKTWGGKILSKMKEGLEEKEGSFFSKISTFVQDVNSKLSGIGAATNIGLAISSGFSILTEQLNEKNLPHFATGRIVKAPTLAVVGDNPGAGTGDPEVVAPLSKLRGMMGTTSDGKDSATLSEMLTYMKRLYETFYVYTKNGGNNYEFVAKMNGSEMFKEMIRQNDLYKKRHSGQSAF